MSLHPIAVVEHALEGYRSYLETEFRARDEKLRRALETALDEPRFLAQAPFFQAHRPFKAGRRWSELGLDAALARVMERRSGSAEAYLHQSEAVAHLLSATATPLVVTTGTGSGKTECFLLPVIQNALEDRARFQGRSGLTAILVYPMNALANDQEERARQYLEESGHGNVTVGRYDRTTPEEERKRMRASPPAVLLTNYVMLEYLLTRPADREDLFKNHRCRFVVLDEVHTYRGSLGANIALLFRRLATHLKHAQHDLAAGDRSDPRRFPELLPVATSATIKSLDDPARDAETLARERDRAVQEFLGSLTGRPAESFRVIGETIRDLEIPAEARWPAAPAALAPPDPRDAEAVRRAVVSLAGLGEGASLEQAVRSAGILWKLSDLLARRPLPVSGLVERVRAEVPERKDADESRVRREVETALVAGAALPDGVPGALRLRTHRLIRGGWRFHRCVDPACGRLYPMGEDACACGRPTAPLYLCRGCGADTLRFTAIEEDEGPALSLQPGPSSDATREWLLYDVSRYQEAARSEEEEDTEAGEAAEAHGPGSDETPGAAGATAPGSGAKTKGKKAKSAAHGLVGTEKQMKGRLVREGSFDPATCSFSGDTKLYPVPVVLAPSRNRCLVCGGLAGSRSILTPVALGTSAAVRVISEGLVEALAVENARKPGHDGKERLLIFSDSRQDAAHQARFISYAGRYDRMRRRLVGLLSGEKTGVTIDGAVRALAVAGVEAHDNPRAAAYRDARFLPDSVREEAQAWEEAPLLDDIAVTAGYRATVVNLGLAGVDYGQLGEYVQARGRSIADALGIELRSLAHVCRALLEEMRRRSALSRPLLQFHPASPSCPNAFRGPADWERRLRAPTGYPCDAAGEPRSRVDPAALPEGLKAMNAWRPVSGKGRAPALQQRLEHLLARLGGREATEDNMLDLLAFLAANEGPRFLAPQVLAGFKKSATLLQVNADSVLLVRLDDATRRRCTICSLRMHFADVGMPCPACHGNVVEWPEAEARPNRYVQRILASGVRPLVAGEHTAQVIGQDRLELEESFKAPPTESPVNVLACSPTLELGIDVGGLDAVVLRNVPPRPDNYAQRGGRAGRRTRVGIVLGYARSTPHDAYFFDRPEEMIAGEVPAPQIGLGNRDVVLRHLYALAIGGAEPPLAGRMAEYVGVQGELNQEAIGAFVDALEKRFPEATRLAQEAWGPEILVPARLDTPELLRAALDALPGHVRKLLDRVRLQILELERAIQQWTQLARGDRPAMHAMELKRRLLGIRDDRGKASREADDRTAGHPMRRFAEHGLLPGYEFPTEPATLRLLADRNEDDPVAVERRFGLAQFQPEARVHARGHRWRVIGLDLSSPWNPRSGAPTWVYVQCKLCSLLFGAQEHGSCPRCGSAETAGSERHGYDFGGFIATRDDTPVLEEEDRFAVASLVRCHPQRGGEVARRYRLATGWTVEVRRGEEVRWVNEGRPPSRAELEAGTPVLHQRARGFPLCPECGRLLSVAPPQSDETKGIKKAKKVTKGSDAFGHQASCAHAGQPPRPLALATATVASTFRILVPLPTGFDDGEYLRWGNSLGYALRTGMRQRYMLDGPEIEFELEPAWDREEANGVTRVGSLVFIDDAVGGSGFLDRAAEELHLVARRAAEHLDHAGCESACYRCLKSYQNQRLHEHLDWPRVIADLEELAQSAPERTAPEVGDKLDASAWLEAYAAGVGSPLELRFLRLFEQHGLAVDKQVPVAPDDGERPISVADFVVRGNRTAIYVDGAAFHQGARLRRDRFIRDRLRAGAPAWRVVELRAADLSRVGELTRDLAAAATE